MVKGRPQNTFHFVEIAVPWSYEGQNGSALISAYRKKVGKYQEVLAELERKRPGYQATQTTIIVSPTGAFLRESQEEFAKVSKLPRAKLAVHSRCIVDAAIQGAYEQWREFGKRMAHAKEIRSLHPEETRFVRVDQEDDLAKMGSRIYVTCILPESISQEAVIHFGTLEWAGKVKRSYDDEQLVREAQKQLGIEGTWNPREAVIVDDVRNIEAIKSETIIDKPDLPKDANVTFNYGGTCKTVALKSGATAAQQAQAAQQAFNITLECGPIEEDGDGYVVHVFKP
jgi:hypothetical protein